MILGNASVEGPFGDPLAFILKPLIIPLSTAGPPSSEFRSLELDQVSFTWRVVAVDYQHLTMHMSERMHHLSHES